MILNFSTNAAAADGLGVLTYPEWAFGDQPALPGQPIGQVKETILLKGAPASNPGVPASADDPADNAP